MPRFYLPAEQWQASRWEVRGAEAYHALRVLRLRPGDTCTLFDGQGRAAKVRIVTVDGASAFQVEALSLFPPLKACAEIILCQAIPKGSNMELVLQKAVELGVRRIVPLFTERTIVRLSGSESINKAEKWRRVILEACKQCGQDTLPVLDTPRSYADFLEHVELPDFKVQAALVPNALPMRTALEPAREAGFHSAALLVGPEGDFTPEEYAAARTRGFLPLSLGSIVLRVETAAFLAISALRYALDPE